jgi:hypothetical protein
MGNHLHVPAWKDHFICTSIWPKIESTNTFYFRLHFKILPFNVVLLSEHGKNLGMLWKNVVIVLHSKDVFFSNLELKYNRVLDMLELV